jgi:hypothetical protein
MDDDQIPSLPPDVCSIILAKYGGLMREDWNAISNGFFQVSFIHYTINGMTNYGKTPLPYDAIFPIMCLQNGREG